MEALKEIVESTQDDLVRFCYYLVRDKGRAEDLAQETYLKAFDSLEALRDQTSIKSWLFRLAKNQFIDWIRKKKVEEKHMERFKKDDGFTSTHYEILEVLNQLEDEDRMAIILVDREGLSYKEAAEVVGISESAMKSRLFRSRQKFIEIWELPETIGQRKTSG